MCKYNVCDSQSNFSEFEKFDVCQICCTVIIQHTNISSASTGVSFSLASLSPLSFSYLIHQQFLPSKMSSSPFFPKVKGAEKEEEDRLCKELTSLTVCIENLLHLVPFPQALLKNKLIELELAVFKLTGPSTDSLKAQLKQKLAYYWEVYAEAPFSVLHSKKTSSSLERVPPSTSSSSCFLAVNSSGTVEANVMTPVPAVNNQFSSSSLLAILPPPLPLSPPPTSLDLTSILENFCPLMENKYEDESYLFFCVENLSRNLPFLPPP